MEKKEVAIHIVDYTPDSTSSADVDREEMKWESREEKYLDSIHKQCLDLSEQHNNASKKAKTKFGACSIPSCLNHSDSHGVSESVFTCWIRIYKFNRNDAHRHYFGYQRLF